MTISQLIAKLQALQAEHGDLLVATEYEGSLVEANPTLVATTCDTVLYGKPVPFDARVVLL